VSGHCHLRPHAADVSCLTLRIDDAERIFYDFDAFGMSLNADKHIEALVADNSARIGRPVNVGPEPQIVYFTGKRDIALADTAIGRVTVTHNPSVNPLAAPHRAAIENRILIGLSFEVPLPFYDAIKRLTTLLQFIELIGGRPPNIEWSTLTLASDSHAEPLDLYWCSQALRPAHGEQRAPHPSTILVDAIRSREEFERVLTAWMAMEETRAEARARFSANYRQQSMFEVDRLVAAANMFDILPDDALPAKQQLPEDVAKAKEAARSIFRALPSSDERESILGALGRLGQRTLRQKIEHRAAIVAKGMACELDGISLVIDEAVKCRNHFVHGSPSTIDYTTHWHLMVFLTRALEFIFGAADLLDAGWDAGAWRRRAGVLAHPFKTTLVEWDQAVSQLRDMRNASRLLPA
jgi:hypothetical protein